MKKKKKKNTIFSKIVSLHLWPEHHENMPV